MFANVLFSPTADQLMYARALADRLPEDGFPEHLGRIICGIHGLSKTQKDALRDVTEEGGDLSAFREAVDAAINNPGLQNLRIAVTPEAFRAAAHAYLLGLAAKEAGHDQALDAALKQGQLDRAADIVSPQSDPRTLAWTAALFRTHPVATGERPPSAKALEEGMQKAVWGRRPEDAGRLFAQLVHHAAVMEEEVDWASIRNKFGAAGVPGLLPDEREIVTDLLDLGLQAKTKLIFPRNVQTLGLFAQVRPEPAERGDYVFWDGEPALVSNFDPRCLGKAGAAVGYAQEGFAFIPERIEFGIAPVDAGGREGERLKEEDLPPGNFVFKTDLMRPDLGLPEEVDIGGRRYRLEFGSFGSNVQARRDGDYTVLSVGADSVKLHRSSGMKVPA